MSWSLRVSIQRCHWWQILVYTNTDRCPLWSWSYPQSKCRKRREIVLSTSAIMSSWSVRRFSIAPGQVWKSLVGGRCFGIGREMQSAMEHPIINMNIARRLPWIWRSWNGPIEKKNPAPNGCAMKYIWTASPLYRKKSSDYYSIRSMNDPIDSLNNQLNNHINFAEFYWIFFFFFTDMIKTVSHLLTLD